jgi:signal peptide peptidase SppA
MPSTLDPLRIDMNAVPQLNLEQYLGPWAIEEMAFRQQWDLVCRMDLLAHMKSSVVQQAAVKSKVPDSNIVQIAIRGTMTKHGSSLSDAGSTIRVRQEIRSAKNDSNVDGVLFRVETPGGTVAGTSELSQDIWELSQVKPTVTFAEDLMASAGLMAFSQSRKVFANTDSSIIGSMGTMFAMLDRSGEAAIKGIVPVLIATGELKGAGLEGLPVSEAVKEMWRQVVDEAQAGFVSVIQRARKPTAAQMTELSRGGVFSAKTAISMGLIDGICSYDAAVAELRAMISPKRKGTRMSEENEKPRAATLPELEAVCVGADAGFLLGQLKQGVTVEGAQKAWSCHQAETILDLNQKLTASQSETVAAKAAHEAEVTKLKADHATELAKFKQSGGKFTPLAEVPKSGKTIEETEGTAKARWASAKAVLVANGMSASAATQKLVRDEPELHAAYVAECNGK